MLVLFLAAVACLIAAAGVSRSVVAAATITVVNLDNAGEGFNDPTPVAPVGGNLGATLGAQRLNAFQHAANLWGAAINSTVTIRVGANFDPLPCTATQGVLGSAGPNFVFREFTNAPLANTWYPEALANSLAGFDLNPSSDDVGATFNSDLGAAGCLTGIFWYFGLDGNPPANTIDFVTVLLHEIAHGLGFLTFVSLGSGTKFFGFNDMYMVHLENHGASPADYPSMSDAQRVAASIATGNLHWTGPQVTLGRTTLHAGVSNGHVRMYAPNPQQPGSSVSHFDTTLFPNELMEPSYTGVIRNLTMTRLLFRDIGWSIDVILNGFWTKIKEGCAPPCFAKGKFVVRNDGEITAPAGASLKFYHSTDAVFDSGDTLIQTVTLGALAPGATQSTKLKGQTAAGSAPAGGFIIAVLEQGGVVSRVVSFAL